VPRDGAGEIDDSRLETLERLLRVSAVPERVRPGTSFAEGGEIEREGWYNKGRR